MQVPVEFLGLTEVFAVVALRMKRLRARWKNATGEYVLHLRALVLSDRWTQAIPRAFKSLRKLLF